MSESLSYAAECDGGHVVDAVGGERLDIADTGGSVTKFPIPSAAYGAQPVGITGRQTETPQVGLIGTGTRLLAKQHRLKVKLAMIESAKTVASKTITFKATPTQKPRP
jgi:hypothetical protein